MPTVNLPFSSSVRASRENVENVVKPPQIPVATVGIGNAKNAAYLALEILALKYPEIKTKLMEFRKKLAEEAALQGGNGVSL